MKQVSSTQAKQAFGELLEAATQGPVAVEKHGKVKAILAAPEFFTPQPGRELALAQRRAARAQQALLEQGRLVKHQRLAIDLLRFPAARRRAMIQRARDEVARWQDQRLCSPVYIEKWQALLALPPAELAVAMASDLDGWGTALRQNSPWVEAPD